MGAAENLVASWNLIQGGKVDVKHLQSGDTLWSLRAEKELIELNIYNLDELISLLEEVITASAPLRKHILNILEAYGYEPEGLIFSKLNISSLSKVAWFGELLARNNKRFELYVEEDLMLVLGAGAKPGLLGLAGMKYVEAPRKSELLLIFKKFHPLMKKLK